MGALRVFPQSKPGSLPGFNDGQCVVGVAGAVQEVHDDHGLDDRRRAGHGEHHQDDDRLPRPPHSPGIREPPAARVGAAGGVQTLPEDGLQDEAPQDRQ
eukprot:3936489-Rhodomonas_salina.1